MGYKCCVFGCSSGKDSEKKKRYENQTKEEEISVFSFPDEEKEPELRRKWIRFVNRKDWSPTKFSKVCEKHFDEKYIKRGQRPRLIRSLDPVPTLNDNVPDLPPSILPTPQPLPRKLPTKRGLTTEDELKKFREMDKIENFNELNESCAPEGFLFKRGPDFVIYFNLEEENEFGIPFVNVSIRIDSNLRVNLFLKGSPVPHPEWFRKGNHTDCKLTSKGMIINFVNHLRIASKLSLLDELMQIKNYKPKGRPAYSTDILR